MSDADGLVLLFAIVMIGTAILLGIAFPSKETSASWNSTRPASQKDVADVVKYKTPRGAEPRALPLVILLAVVFGFVLIFGAKFPPL